MEVTASDIAHIGVNYSPLNPIERTVAHAGINAADSLFNGQSSGGGRPIASG